MDEERIETLKTELRSADTLNMTTEQLVEFCRTIEPECHLPEIAAALKQAGEEDHAEADALQSFADILSRFPGRAHMKDVQDHEPDSELLRVAEDLEREEKAQSAHFVREIVRRRAQAA